MIETTKIENDIVDLVMRFKLEIEELNLSEQDKIGAIASISRIFTLKTIQALPQEQHDNFLNDLMRETKVDYMALKNSNEAHK